MSPRIRALVLLALSSAHVSACGMTPEGCASTTNAPPCPSDLEAAVGAPCASAGQICAPGGPAPNRMIECAGGTWTELSVRPSPTSAPPPAGGEPESPRPAP